MFRIVVLADSLSLPRNQGKDVLKWEQTWPWVLQNKLNSSGGNYEVINCGKRARRVDSINGRDFIEDVILKEPNILIIQVGVVDAAPRIISLKEKILLNNRFFPSRARKWIIRNRNLKRKEITNKDPLAKVYTKPGQFKNGLIKFDIRVKSDYRSKLEKVIFLPILANLTLMEEKSPGYKSNISLYNKILEEFCCERGYIFLKIDTQFYTNANYFCSDGYHLNPSGSSSIAMKIKDIILDVKGAEGSW